MTVAERLAETMTELSRQDGLGTKYIVSEDGRITTEGGVTSMDLNYAADLLQKDRAKYMRLVQIIDNFFADIHSCDMSDPDPGLGGVTPSQATEKVKVEL